VKTRSAVMLFSLVIVLVMNAAPTHAETPTPSPTPTQSAPAFAPLDHPLKPPTQAQLNEAKDCDPEELVKGRYQSLAPNEFPDAFKPVTACDWAALAVAYVADTDQEKERPPEGKVAFLRAIELNPAMAFVAPLWDRYFASFVAGEPAIKAPFAGRKLRRVLLSLKWGGGMMATISSIKYNLVITAPNDNEATVTGQLTTVREPVTPEPGEDTEKLRADGRIQAKIDRKLFDNLSDALTDLIPVKETPALVPCNHNRPDWQATLEYTDGTRVLLTTKGSNMFFAGGPWYATINRQPYVQYSARFIIAVAELRAALNLPYGTTASMSCFGLDDELLNLFFVKKAGN
jgi:hypothetical protein